jgi:CDP-diacylglycerol--serine O-phosphatidyltransferase
MTTLESVLLWVSVALCALVALRGLGVLSRRRIADLLSLGNLACGAACMVLSARGHYELGLLCLLFGAACDGLDGAAARRFGGSRWGFLADDIADGVTYGIAPGFAVFTALGGVEGAVVGAAFTLFVIGRLIFFTLNKATADPSYFAGAPSTAGGIIAMCAVVLFRAQPALIGLLIGLACAHMVAFDSLYRHFGRSPQRALAGAPLYILLLLGSLVWGSHGPIALLLASVLIYGFWPATRAFRRVLAPPADA